MKYILPLLLLTLLFPHPSQAHNGAVAIAVPVEGIVIDGDLSDWPEGMRVYSIKLPEYGVAPRDSLDFKGSFRIGFNGEENALYVAVEVRDDSVIIDTTTVNHLSWDASDGCDVYISLPYPESSGVVFHHALWGNYRYSLGTSAGVAVKRTHNRHTYEWRIDIDQNRGKAHLQSGISLGIDVVVGDKDEDGSFSWMAWGFGTGKMTSSDRVGLVVLSEEDTFGTIKGRIKWEDMEEGTNLGRVRIQSLTLEELWVEVKTDSQGVYEVEVPAGDYRIEASYMRRQSERTIVQIKVGERKQIEEIFCAIPLWRPIIKEDLTPIISRFMEDFEIVGLAIGIVKGNDIIYAKGFGVKDLATQEPVTETSLFHMASVSKPFSATALVQLAEQGKVDLDAPVVRYVPYFRLKDDRYEEITIRQMLTHTSGMPDVQDYHWDTPEYDDGALERYVRSLTEEELIAAPGEIQRYSNMAFEILGDVIAKISEKSFEEYQREHILEPLAMYESTFLQMQTAPELRTTPHVKRIHPVVSSVYPYHRAHAPSSTLHSNVVEMCHWAMANLNQGVFKGRRILNPSSYQELWPFSGGENRSLSWFLGNYRGRPSVGHSGGDVGYRTQFLLLPEDSLGVVVLSNYDGTPTGNILTTILDVTLGYEVEYLKIPISIPLGKILVEEGIETAITSYHRLKRDSFGNYDFAESHLNSLGYRLLSMDRIEDAIEIFKLNVVAFPASFDVYDSLGEAYMLNENKDLAIQSYKKSIELNPENQNGIEMLRDLEQ
jgi:CubicO group peptidase (beta-lactamase class C family)